MPFLLDLLTDRQGARRLSWARHVLGFSALCVLVANGHVAGGVTPLSPEQMRDASIVGASKYEQKQYEVAAGA